MNPKLFLVELKQPLFFLFFPLLSLEEILSWQPRLSPALHRKQWGLSMKCLLYCPRGLPKRTYFMLPGEMGEVGFQWWSPGNYGGRTLSWSSRTSPARYGENVGRIPLQFGFYMRYSHSPQGLKPLSEFTWSWQANSLSQESPTHAVKGWSAWYTVRVRSVDCQAVTLILSSA